MADQLTPLANLEGFSAVTISYDAEDDLLYLHLDAPRPAVTEALGEGWYLRVSDGAVVGLELHGFRAAFLTSPFFAILFGTVSAELDHVTPGAFSEPMTVTRPRDELPRATRAIILLLGLALARFEAMRRNGLKDAGKDLLAAS